jgi:hypothetical protein
MNSQDFRSLQEAYMEVVENQQLDEVSDRKVRAVRDAREKQWNKQFGKNRVQDPTDDMVDRVDKLIDQRNKRTGSKVKKTTMGQLRDKYRKKDLENKQTSTTSFSHTFLMRVMLILNKQQRQLWSI